MRDGHRLAIGFAALLQAGVAAAEPPAPELLEFLGDWPPEALDFACTRRQHTAAFCSGDGGPDSDRPDAAGADDGRAQGPEDEENDDAY